MPELTVDGRTVRVEPGTTVIRAAEAAGIFVPRFCYHPALGSVGACRMCAVMFTDGPAEGLLMSCMIEAQDGMVVSTDHPEAVSFRRHVVEWLMLNHPHDCPVCDEGGHCLLQDLTVSGGHGLRRYPGLKRTFRDQYLGPLIRHEMNRCIQCYRCVRFYREYAGYRDLGATGIAAAVYFGRYADGPLESPFSGNLIDLCPTGVFTDGPSCHSVRRWDLERRDSVCLHCSLACPVLPGARYRRVHRVESPVSDECDGPFICDRGRYGFGYANRPDRPRSPRADGVETGLPAALGTASERLGRVMREWGSAAVACLASLRSPLETLAALSRISRSAGWRPPEMFPHARAKQIARSAAAGFKQRTAVSAAEIEKADFLLLLGLDPVNEAPALALSLRQAVRGGAGAAVLDPRPVSLPFAFDHLPVPARHLESGLGALVKQAFANRELDGDPEAEAFRQALPDSAPGCEPHTLQTLGDRLARSERPVLLTGPDILPGAAPGFAAECARFLASALGGCGFFPVLPGPNAFGAALLDFLPGRGAEDLVAAMEQGEVKALLVAEADPLSAFPDRDRLHRALGSLELLCVLDYLPSETVGLADVLLPVRTVFEQEASFVSQAGDVRFARKVHEGGLPLDQAAGGGHPPREFSAAIPGGAPEPGWRVLADLGRRLGLRHAQSEGEGRELAAEELGFPLTDAAARAGLSALSRGGAGFPSSGEPDPPAGGFDLDVLCVDLTFGTEELSSYSPVLRDFAPAPFVLLHTSDAERVSLQDGQTVSLSLTAGRLRAELRTTRGMAPGTLIVPRLAGWPWQMLATGTRIDLRCIQAARTDRPGQGGDPE